MFTLKHELESIFLMIIAGCCAAVLLHMHTKAQKAVTYLPAVSSVIFATPTPAPLLSPIAQVKTTTTSVTSADGASQLFLQAKVIPSGTTIYSLFIDSLQGSPFYTMQQQKGTITLPFNSWSTDNKYFFITQTTDIPHFLLFQASLTPFAHGKQYIDISSLFEERYPHVKSFQVTGWASQTLLIITTTNTDGLEGQSFWFDVPSQSFIPLATEF